MYYLCFTPLCDLVCVIMPQWSVVQLARSEIAIYVSLRDLARDLGKRWLT